MRVNITLTLKLFFALYSPPPDSFYILLFLLFFVLFCCVFGFNYRGYNKNLWFLILFPQFDDKVLYFFIRVFRSVLSMCFAFVFKVSLFSINIKSKPRLNRAIKNFIFDLFTFNLLTCIYVVSKSKYISKYGY